MSIIKTLASPWRKALPDDRLLRLGTDSNGVIVSTSDVIAADAGLSSVIVGTSDHQGVAAGSIIIAAVLADADMIFLVNDGGNSKEFLRANADVASVQLGHGMTTATLKTTSGALTLAPGGDIVASSAVDIQGGYANDGGAPYDGVVDAAGGGNWTTLQAGDDALDAAINTVMLVKSGTYSTLTVSTNNVKIVCEPGTIVTGAIVLSGDNITLVLGAGCDIRGLITMSGDNCSLLCENGVDLDGIIASGVKALIDGGGWATISNGGTANDGIELTSTSTDSIVQNISVQTTGGSQIGLLMDAARQVGRNVQVIDADHNGIDVGANASDCLVEGCYVLDCGNVGVVVRTPRARIVGNHILSAGSHGINGQGGGDDSIFTGNIVQDQGNTSLILDANCDNCVVVANRLDGAMTDNSTDSTVASNNETAF